MDVRHLLGLKDLPAGAAEEIFAEAKFYKRQRGRKKFTLLDGQTWALIFSKSSTRTRVSFEVGIRELGGHCLFLSSQDIQLGRGEPIADTARVLGRMTHGAIIRAYAQKDAEDFARFARIPTINALTDEEHPCQVLADVFTFQEKRGPIAGKRVVFIGDAACNVARSWVYAAKVFNFQLVLAAPKKYFSPVTNAYVTQTESVPDAVRGADLLYTDVWVSMGMEAEGAEREKNFKPYQINHEVLKLAKKDALVLHCLPAYRGKEITAELLEEREQDIFDQAENRLHVQKGILHWLVHSRIKARAAAA
jgi:ornithine carbamoyltransferase